MATATEAKGRQVICWVDQKRQDVVPLLPILVLDFNIFFTRKPKENLGSEGIADCVKGIIASTDSLNALYKHGFAIVLACNKIGHALIDMTKSNWKLRAAFANFTMILSVQDPINIIHQTFGIGNDQIVVLTRDRDFCVAAVSHNVLTWKRKIHFGDFLWGISRWRRLKSTNRVLIGSIFPLLRRSMLALSPLKKNRFSDFQPVYYPILLKDVKTLKSIKVLIFYRPNPTPHSQIVLRTCEDGHSYYAVDCRSPTICPLCVKKMINLSKKFYFTFSEVKQMWNSRSSENEIRWFITCSKGHSVFFTFKNFIDSKEACCNICTKIKKEEEEEEQVKERKRKQDEREEQEQQWKRDWGKQRERRQFEDFFRNYFSSGGFSRFSSSSSFSANYTPRPIISTPTFFTNTAEPSDGDRKASIDWLLRYKNNPEISLCLTTTPAKDGACQNKEVITKHYRRIALLVHPDKNKLVGATEAFKILVSSNDSLMKDL